MSPAPPDAAARRLAGTAAARGITVYWAPAHVLHALAAVPPVLDDPYPEAADGSWLAACDQPGLVLSRLPGRWELAAAR